MPAEASTSTATPTGGRPRGRRWAFAVATTLVVLLLPELIARALLPRASWPVLATPLGPRANAEADQFVRRDATLFWELVPNVRRDPPSQWGDVVNGDGLRMRREVTDRDGRIRVACFGDSCTYGLGLPVDDAWPTILDSDPSLDVINAGVPGYSSYQGALLADRRCPDWKPDVVVIQFGFNDATPWPQEDRGRTVALTDAERAAHVRIDALLRYSAFLAWATSRAAPPAPHDAAAGDLPPRVPPDEFRANLLRIAERAPLAVVLQWPVRAAVDPTSLGAAPPDVWVRYAEAMASTSSSRIEYVNLTDDLRRSGLSADDAFLDRIHGKRALCELVARTVRESIRSRLHR